MPYRCSSPDKIAIFIVPHEGKIDEVHDHHRNDRPKDGTDKKDQKEVDDQIRQPKPPSILQECIVSHE